MKLVHEYSYEGWHRLRNEDTDESGPWAMYEGVCVWPAPKTGPPEFIAFSPYMEGTIQSLVYNVARAMPPVPEVSTDTRAQL